MSLLGRLAKSLPFGTVAEISARDLAAALERTPPPQLVDVRTRTEWRLSRIEGARHARMAELERGPLTLGLEPARPVVCICLSGHRSIPAVRALRDLGFSDVRQLSGGMLAWLAAGLPTIRGR
jgi:rhodanese-related sulfurtransferase